jgi:hypothetical protein
MEQTLPPNAAPPTRGFDLASRLRAAGIHLGLSAGVALLAAALVFFVWYPMPFREISGGRELFFLVVSVDVALGPLITFSVFNRSKPRRELARDLAVVALLQLGALGYGLHTVFVARPVALVLEVDRLRVVTAADLAGQDLSSALPEWQRQPWWGVRVAAARRANSDETFSAVELALQGIDIGARPPFWRPAAEAPAAIAAAAKPLPGLLAHYTARAAELATFVSGTGRSAEQLGYLPIAARRSDWVALIDKASGQIAGYAPFDGF